MLGSKRCTLSRLVPSWFPFVRAQATSARDLNLLACQAPYTIHVCPAVPVSSPWSPSAYAISLPRCVAASGIHARSPVAALSLLLGQPGLASERGFAGGQRAA